MSAQTATPQLNKAECAGHRGARSIQSVQCRAIIHVSTPLVRPVPRAHSHQFSIAMAAAAVPAARDHIVVFPFMAKGHTLPLLHFAAALAAHHGGGDADGVRVTVVTTPANVAFARRRLPPPVAVVALPFPAHPDLPPGVESTDALPSQSLFPAFLRATAALRAPFAAYLASLPSPPLALVSDFFLGFTQRVATEAGVRRLTFHGMSAFSLALCFSLAMRPPPPAESILQDSSVPFPVPGFPEGITITADEVPHAVVQAADADDPVTRFLRDEVVDWEHRSWGVLVNSFTALDGEYAAILESFYLPGARAWLVGPLFLAATAGKTREEEDDADEDPEGCLPWLDERAAGSVVYVSFGTHVHVSAAQLDELAHGLVDSGHAFLWAVRSDADAWAPPVDVAPRGEVVRSWVPQRLVLAHPAVGGFLSHCGWNSVLESLAAGRPMLAWPVMAEQAANAKHVADVIGAGVRVGVRTSAATAKAEMTLVGRAQVADKVRELMDDGEAGRRMRAAAERVRREARDAVGEGGTSRVALGGLVDELRRSYGDDAGDTAAGASINGAA